MKYRSTIDRLCRIHTHGLIQDSIGILTITKNIIVPGRNQFSSVSKTLDERLSEFYVMMTIICHALTSRYHLRFVAQGITLPIL